MEHDMYPSYWDRRRHRPLHRRPITYLPSSENTGLMLMSAGSFLAGAAAAGMAIILAGAGW